jgi:signal transduction histidine kinase/ActR/RegA family two-component response regulator
VALLSDSKDSDASVDSDAFGSSTEDPAGVSFAAVDADFARKLDLWGAYHRMAAASMTMGLTFWIVPQPDWLLWMAGLYLLLSAFVPWLLDRAGSLANKAWVRTLVMLIDVSVVSMFIYRWGARTSPAAFMYVPIVSGWTLIPQRYLGRIAGITVMFAYGVLLGMEQLGWPHGRPISGPATGALLYFVMLACSIAAVHGLLDFTMARLREHHTVVARLTAEKRTRERENQLAQQLEEAQRLESLGRLAGGVAHDFNNLLTVLMGCAELAEMNLTRSPLMAGRSLRDLQVTAERGASLTAQLLDFASRRPTSPRHVDLNDAVRSAAKLLERLLEASVELQVQTWREPCVVHIDPGGLERLLLNLAVNARDAMPQGGALRMSLSTRKFASEEHVLLEVADSGAGIASEDLPHIFEPFFTTKARGKGTGLGLASVYGIVKQSQGQIEVESQPDRGTTFRVRWPRVVDQVAMEPRRLSDPGGGHEQILLVDDDAEVRSVALAHLEGAGYAVLTAASGEEALNVLKRNAHAVQMLVSDVSMPGMSGVELAHEVRALLPTMPILLISGYSEELTGNSERVARFLAKPFSGARLLAEVRDGLNEQRAAKPAVRAAT